MGSKTNWPAVSAIAAVGALFVAFLAYVAPHSRSGSQLVPTTLPVTTATPLPPGPVTSTPATAPTQVPTTTPGPHLSVAPLPPPGCSTALSIVDTYYQTAGTTKYTQKAAARQAAQDMFNATAGVRGGPAFTDMAALYRDFSTMQLILDGMSGQDYSAVQEQTAADAQTLRRVCGAAM